MSVQESQATVLECIVSEIIQEDPELQEIEQGVDVVNTQHESPEEEEEENITTLNYSRPENPPSWHQTDTDWCFVTATCRNDIIGDCEKVILNYIDDYTCDKKKSSGLTKT